MSDDLLLCDKLRAIYPEHKNVNQWDVRYEAAERILLHKAEITRLRAANEKLREALIDATASLVASVSLLERGGKKAAPSDNMFSQMLVDYKNSIDRARAALEGVTEKEGAGNE